MTDMQDRISPTDDLRKVAEELAETIFQKYVKANPMEAMSFVDMREFILSALQKVAPRWRPIETAPHNEDVMLFWPYWCETEAMIGWYDTVAGHWISDYAASTEGEPPTHWLPLPEPPKKEG